MRMTTSGAKNDGMKPDHLSLCAKAAVGVFAMVLPPLQTTTNAAGKTLGDLVREFLCDFNQIVCG